MRDREEREMERFCGDIKGFVLFLNRVALFV